MSNLKAFFVQYQVNSSVLLSSQSRQSRGIATIVVFADGEPKARARAGRMITLKNLEITNFLRIHLIQKSYVELLDKVLRTLYNQAELYGIAIHCDLFPSNASRYSIKHNRQD